MSRRRSQPLSMESPQSVKDWVGFAAAVVAALLAAAVLTTATAQTIEKVRIILTVHGQR